MLLLNTVNHSELSVSCNNYCTRLTGFEAQKRMDPILMIGNGRLRTSDSVNDLENIAFRKDAIAMPADISIVHKESASKRQSRRNRKRKSSIIDETVIGKNL